MNKSKAKSLLQDEEKARELKKPIDVTKKGDEDSTTLYAVSKATLRVRSCRIRPSIYGPGK
jgi:hypothetical protein